MGVILVTALVWCVGIICILVMKKIHPWDKLYPLYVLAVCVIFTVFVISHVF